jgi:hypothetical protein
MKGRKPKASIIKLVTGNPGRRPVPGNEPTPEGRPIKPPKLKGRAAELWDQVAGYPWLTEADSFTLHIWAQLQAQFERTPVAMIASRIAQLRAVAGELGLNPPARARLGTDGKRQDELDPAAKYFG